MMVALSLFVETMAGLTWPRWQRLVTEVERLGFAGLFRSEHLTVPWQADVDALELVVSLTYLADHTHRVHFGPLVAPLSYHDPVMLVRQAVALDELSGGRMILGVGSGWQDREHQMFGYTLGDVRTRMARLKEGLEVMTRLLQSDGPVSYEGSFYNLHDAVLHPRPVRSSRPPIMIGGNGPKRILPLVARYADIWNAAFLTPDSFRERSAQLDELLQAEGREPEAVKRTMVCTVTCRRDRSALERHLQGWSALDPTAATRPRETLLEEARADPSHMLGTPEEVVEQIRAYGEAGVEELMMMWTSLDDIDGLELIAEEVLPFA